MINRRKGRKEIDQEQREMDGVRTENNAVARTPSRRDRPTLCVAIRLWYDDRVTVDLLTFITSDDCQV